MSALIRQRIEAICATIAAVETVLTGEESDITTLMLPAVRVLPGRRIAQVPNGAHSALITRNFRILVYASAPNEAHIEDQEADAISAAEDWLDVLSATFRACPRLELSGAGLAYVTGTGEMTNNEEPGWLLYQKQAYTGLIADLPVTYRSA